MSAAMPVLSALLSGEHLRRIDVRGENALAGLGPLDPEVRKGLAEQYAHFDVQVASELYWQGTQDYFVWGKDYPGIFRLPFPHVWMEWETPDMIRMDGKIQPRLYQDMTMRSAAGIRETSPEEAVAEMETLGPVIDPATERVILMVMFTRMPTENPYVLEWPIIKSFQVGKDGTAICVHDMWLGEENDPEQRARANEWKGALGDLNVAAHALALINCRNVATTDGGRVQIRRTTAQKRRREMEDVRYKTIVLPGTTGSSGGSQTGNAKQDMAFHKVRGHFKHFTAAAPLLGKHVGTYWWGWQVRGNAEHGSNVNEYQLSP